jgi:hypothetical protein
MIFFKCLLQSVFLLFSIQSNGQIFFLPDGEYMDTTNTLNESCNSHFPYYYQVGCKYPRSSSTLLLEVQNFMNTINTSFSGSGYITFRCGIDCEGKKLSKVEIIQVDEYYKNYHFNKVLIHELFTYFKSLNKWKSARSLKGLPLNYMAFITFKIHDGKVVNIIP